MTLKLAFDRSARSIDVDGRLHVKVSNISKAAVNPYLGREIPGADALGLDPDKIYMLLRDPAELKKAAASFNNIPLLSTHVPVTADDHQPDLVVGSTGTDAEFDGTYLKNSLVVWESIAIAGIESREQCELSSAYRYTPVMTPGIYGGVAYDGVMTNIIGNHVALVEVGRAGSDVVVGDSNLSIMEQPTMKQKRIAMLTAALISSLPKLAQDAAFDPKELATKLAMALDAESQFEPDDKKKPAEDEGDDCDSCCDMIKTMSQADVKKCMACCKSCMDGDKPAADEDGKSGKSDCDKCCAMMKSMSPADLKKCMACCKACCETAEDEEEVKKDKSMAGMPGMDAALKAVEKATIARMNAIRQAEKEVQPLIGEVVAQDSAEAVYKLALDNASVDLTGVHASAYGAMVRMLPKPGDIKQPRVAMDAASTSDFAKRFPTAGKLVRS
jgi:hypothetical protein